jgi:hypothetical protein
LFSGIGLGRLRELLEKRITRPCDYNSKNQKYGKRSPHELAEAKSFLAGPVPQKAVAETHAHLDRHSVGAAGNGVSVAILITA